MTALDVTREQVLAFRRRTSALDARRPAGRDALRRAAWAGLRDSMPRAALLSLHARVDGVRPTALDDDAFVQLWGPGFAAYVVAAEDRAVFTRSRLPDSGPRRRLADGLADRLEALLGDGEMPYGEAGRALGVHHNQLRYAAPTGRVLIRWDGARQPTIRMAPVPDVEPSDARAELARRHLHVMGPGTPESFGDYAGLRAAPARAAFDALGPELVPVRTPVGDAWLLASDEEALRAPSSSPPAPARLLPSGDTFYLLRGVDRELLVPDGERRAALWTSRVWPGALLVDGDVVGTWRRAHDVVTVEPWSDLPPHARDAVEREAASLPLPALERPPVVRWVT